MAKNVILIIGDGMGWEMARAGAIYNQVQAEIQQYLAEGKSSAEISSIFSTATLADYYVEGKGSGLEFQGYDGYQLVTTGATKIDGSVNNSALEGSTSKHDTGDAPLREGFLFDPNLNFVNWETLKGGSTPWDANYYENRDNTSNGFDPEYIKADYPDSANTASTLYEGVKTYNGAIAVDIHEHGVETILMEAIDQGKSGGVVSSVPINHATPAAAVAQVNNRNKYQQSSNAGKLGVDGHPLDLTDNILDQILFETQPQVVLGGGNPAGGQSYVTSAQLSSLMGGSYQLMSAKDDGLPQVAQGPTVEELGWTVLGRNDNYTDANASKTSLEILEAAVDAFNPETDHLMGIYGAKGQGGNLPWRTADSDYSATGTGAYADNSNTNAGNTALSGDALQKELASNPTVAQLAGQALEALGKDKDGFWLMVEVGDIDWAAHADNMDLLLGTMQDINDVTKTVNDWVAANGGWEENLVLVTADHDHYLTLLDNFPEVAAQSILASLAGNNEETSGVNTGYDTLLTPTLTISGKSQWETGDAEAAGHFWGTETKLIDGQTGIGDGWWTHTQRPVPVYYQGEGSEVVDLFTSTGVSAYGTVINGVPGMIDQAHIAEAMEAVLLGGETADQRLMAAQSSVISPIVALSAEDDAVFMADPANQVTLRGNTLFTGAGSDEVDVATAEGFNNTIFTGSGADVIYAGSLDVITGGSGNDEIWADAGNNNRLSGNAGDDLFIIGSSGNRALGGDGNDRFDILETAGTNYLNGGAGVDQFWLVRGPGDLPTAKQFVMDFKAGEDLVGLQGIAYADLSFTQVGADTLLSVGGIAVGHFTNVNASTLNNQANFAGLS